jgi:hypothetical protein
MDLCFFVSYVASRGEFPIIRRSFRRFSGETGVP